MAFAPLNISALEEGDLIEISRGWYKHWAVYIGDEEVVHLTGDGRSLTSASSGSQQTEGSLFDKAEVKRQKVRDVIGDSKVRIDRKSSPFSGKEIKDRALSKEGEIGYHVLIKNCEHFAKWCRYDKAFSWQTLTKGTFR